MLRRAAALHHLRERQPNYTEQKSERVRQHWQEINDIPKPKWLPFTQIEIYTVGLLLHSVFALKILFYIYFTV